MRAKTQKKKTIDPAAIPNKEVFEMMSRKDSGFCEEVAKEVEKIRRREQRKKFRQSSTGLYKHDGVIKVQIPKIK